MTMHKALFPPPAEADKPATRGVRIPDMPVMLAVLAARQRILPTATAMRSQDGGMGIGPADRMVRLFVSPGSAAGSAAGAFNGGVAQYLSGTGEKDGQTQGEGDVYRGA